MLKRFVVAAAMVALGATAASAAPMNAKVYSVEKDTVRVVAAGKLQDWVKQGSKVRFLGAKGTIVRIAADTVSIATPKAAQAKVGSTVTFDKPRVGVSGC